MASFNKFKNEDLRANVVETDEVAGQDVKRENGIESGSIK